MKNLKYYLLLLIFFALLVPELSFGQDSLCPPNECPASCDIAGTNLRIELKELVPSGCDRPEKFCLCDYDVCTIDAQGDFLITPKLRIACESYTGPVSLGAYNVTEDDFTQWQAEFDCSANTSIEDGHSLNFPAVTQKINYAKGPLSCFTDIVATAAQDNLPTIDLVDGAIWGTPKVGEETSLKLTATDKEGVSKGISTITVDWGYDNKKTVLPCGGTEICTLEFSHTYEQGGEFWITAWATDLDNNESEHKQWIRIIKEKEDRVGISIEHSPTGVTGRAITIKVTAWHENGINSISVEYDGEKSDVQLCPGVPGQCIRSFSKIYDTAGTYGGKAWATSGSLKSYELPFSYEIIKSERPPENGTGPGLIEVTNPLSAADFKDFIDKLVRFLFTICLIVVPILLIVAGIMFVTSQGDPEKARKAQKMILFTLIGFAIISLARIFVSFIEQIFGK